MKLIILEGGDRLGKSTIIEKLCKAVNYDNVCVRHFGKPPKGLTPEEFTKFQFECFTKELKLFYYTQYEGTSDKYHYYPDTMIWNRSHLGEYVYSQMFRGGKPDVLKNMLLDFERGFISHDVYLITLTADPYFFMLKEDGNSFSTSLEDKTRELQLFKEAHDFSIIPNKLMIKVDQTLNASDKDLKFFNAMGLDVDKQVNIFRSKKDIFKEVKEFVKIK